ncbi:hypothetical protein Pmani_000303 [Petrolisthes manimaculis]|uniref:Uncharacterized protein n=1 Tax=Petrolisthes manimaculis TaxID=1843537 RepID=A0AAE1QQE4_9EUCA|nr:hypothetical protein Pmani_000303 [Petrolisthes manimaculis]
MHYIVETRCLRHATGVREWPDAQLIYLTLALWQHSNYQVCEPQKRFPPTRIELSGGEGWSGRANSVDMEVWQRGTYEMERKEEQKSVKGKKNERVSVEQVKRGGPCGKREMG